jgi:hypothetical protein
MSVGRLRMSTHFSAIAKRMVDSGKVDAPMLPVYLVGQPLVSRPPTIVLSRKSER